MRASKPAFRSGARRAFTLVEIVVAIGLLSVLAALLLPVVTGARARAREAACTEQLKQLGRAFQLYEADHQARPPRLHALWPRYVTDRRLFLCPEDRWAARGGWAWSAWGQFNTPVERWPLSVSYGYFFSSEPADPIWESAQSAPGRPGYVVCVLHGKQTRSHLGGPDAAPLFAGRTFRLCFDGGVIARDIRTGGFNAWKLLTDQDRPPDLP